MKTRIAVIATLVCFAFHNPTSAQSPAGRWDAQIECPGGAIDFRLELKNKDSSWTGSIHNGPERIEIPSVQFDGKDLVISIDHYDSRLLLRLDSNSKLTGVWKKRRGPDKRLEMPVSAKRAVDLKKATSDLKMVAREKFLGRWEVKFESDNDLAVGLFQTNGARVLGNFMTTTGDYRYLDGVADKDGLRLSCFDGAHAFLFKARLLEDGTLAGDFWSSNTWHDKFTAVKNDNAELPDDFKQTALKETDLSGMSFPGLDGNPTRLDDPKFSNKARIIYVFGSWCPNCHDAADYFSELEAKYGDRGLSILGLAFEVTGDFDRDSKQVRTYLKRHGSKYPVLIAGLADKAKASKALPLLDRVRSYPTTIFLDRNNQVQAIHTGFTGPATGETYESLKRKFEALIEGLIEN